MRSHTQAFAALGAVAGGMQPQQQQRRAPAPASRDAHGGEAGASGSGADRGVLGTGRAVSRRLRRSEQSLAFLPILLQASPVVVELRNMTFLRGTVYMADAYMKCARAPELPRWRSRAWCSMCALGTRASLPRRLAPSPPPRVPAPLQAAACNEGELYLKLA